MMRNRMQVVMLAVKGQARARWGVGRTRCWCEHGGARGQKVSLLVYRPGFGIKVRAPGVIHQDQVGVQEDMFM